ncbi:MAG: hypothetical protein ACJAX6_000329 [Limisphaerales bacterium]
MIFGVLRLTPLVCAVTGSFLVIDKQSHQTENNPPVAFWVLGLFFALFLIL